MMKSFHHGLVAIALTTFAAAASASVLDFEDLPNASAPLPAGYFVADYHGFRFGNDDPATNEWFYSTTAHQAGLYFAHSGTNGVGVDTLERGDYFHAGYSMQITRATSFVFDGAWFSGYNDLAYALYVGSTLVYQSAPFALTVSPAFIASGYHGEITGVSFYELALDGGDFFMDDFTYTAAAAPTSVPEPAGLPLLAAGAIVMGIAGRRRRRGQRVATSGRGSDDEARVSIPQSSGFARSLREDDPRDARRASR